VGDELIVPDWPAPRNVRGLVTTRSFGDLKSGLSREKLRAGLPAEPRWLRQVHGTGVIDAARHAGLVDADASFTTRPNVVCAVMVADCMPVLLADAQGGAVGAAHAGWRGLCAGVIESTVAAMGLPATRLIAWLGPAIGPRAYEVGDEVRDAFLKADARAASAFAAHRPGHWLLDLYAVARQRLAALGVASVSGGSFCTASEPARFFSFRRDKGPERMAAAIWLAE
jgi:YfiH family protein